MNFDDNALDRHPELARLRDLDEEDPLEVEASKSNLNYIKLDGNVGCMVNGAGLAMGTMDIIKLAGGRAGELPGRRRRRERGDRGSGFRIILADPHVKAVLINIFGGIVRCDRVATGVVEAAKQVACADPGRGPAGRHQRRARRGHPRALRHELPGGTESEGGGREGHPGHRVTR